MTVIVTQPSATARQLYGQMVARSDDNLILTVSGALNLSIERQRAGMSTQAEGEMTELLAAGWVTTHSSGGWDLTGASSSQGGDAIA